MFIINLLPLSITSIKLALNYIFGLPVVFSDYNEPVSSGLSIERTFSLFFWFLNYFKVFFLKLFIAVRYIDCVICNSFFHAYVMVASLLIIFNK